MQKTNRFQLNVDQVSKLNNLLPKGYKIISIEQNNKRLAQMKKIMQKINYVPIQEVKTIEVTTGRRAKNNVSYYQGEEMPVSSVKGSVQDYYQPQKPPKPKVAYQPQPPPSNRDRQRSNSPAYMYPQRKIATNSPSYMPQPQQPQQQIQMFLPPVFVPPPSTSSQKNTLIPKQILQQLQQHNKFYVIRQYESDNPQKKIYENLCKKVQGGLYGVQELLQEMNNLFINIYGSYQKFSNMYNDAAELEGYLTVLLNTEKAKPKQKLPKLTTTQSASVKQQPPLLNSISSSYPPPPPPARQSSAPQSLLRKKTMPVKPDIKNITIMDKRILGQNIKKLPNQCLPQICKIVYDTLQTRQEYIIDIDTLPIKKVKQLQMYVGMCMARFGDIQDGNQIRNQGESSEESFVIQDDFD